MSDSTNFSMTKSRTHLEPIENGSHVTLNGESTSNITGGGFGTSNYSSSLINKRTKDAFIPLWSTSQELVGLKGEKTHKAFSETSLAQGRSTGIIGSHEYAVLRGLSNDPTKIQVYNRSTPVLFLRNPKLTTSLKVPKLSEVTAVRILKFVVFGILISLSKYSYIGGSFVWKSIRVIQKCRKVFE